MPKGKKRIVESDEDGSSDESSFEASNDDDSDDSNDFEDDSSDSSDKKKKKKKNPTKTTPQKKQTTANNKNLPAKAAKSPAKSANSIAGSKLANASAPSSKTVDNNVKRQRIGEVSSSSSSSALTSAAQSSSMHVSSSALTQSFGDEDITRGAEINTEAAAKKLLIKYLKQQNRPYSALQIYDNLHKRIPKPMLERCLTVLSETPSSSDTSHCEILCKEYGKAKIYFPNQMLMAQNVTESDINKLGDIISSSKSKLDLVLAREREEKHRISALESIPDDDNIDKDIEKLQNSIAAKRQQLHHIEQNPVDVQSVARAVKLYNTTRTHWKARRDLCMEAVEMLAEGMEKPVKFIVGEAGIETDADCGVALPVPINESFLRSR